MNEVQAAAYLAGMIDGEGHVSVRPNHNISISNTDWDIIQAVSESCATLGLHFRVYGWGENRRTRVNRKHVWEVFINGKTSLEKVRDVVPIQSRRKQAALDESIAAFRKSPRPSREWLVQKYWDEGMSLDEVARAWGKKSGASTVQWMRFYGIPARSLSEAAVIRHRKENQHG